MYQLKIIDEFDDKHSFEFYEHQYPSLMELIRNSLGSDIGDCRSRMWCNTCAVQAIHGKVELTKLDNEEQRLLRILNVENTRLSCQLLLTKELHNTEWKILDSRTLF